MDSIVLVNRKQGNKHFLKSIYTMQIMLLLHDVLILLGPVRRVHVPPLADDALACFADDASVVSSIFMVAVWERNSVVGRVALMDDGRKSKGK